MKRLLLALLISPCVFAAEDETVPRFEVRAFGGLNYAPTRSLLFDPRTPPSYGGQVAAALTGTLAAIGTFAYNQAGADFAVPGSGSSIKEWMAGMRFSLPLGDLPVTPYASMSAGKASFKQWTPLPVDNLGVKHSVDLISAHKAIAPAIGADIRFNRSVGVGVEFRAVKAEDVGLYYRLSGSVYYRFR